MFSRRDVLAASVASVAASAWQNPFALAAEGDDPTKLFSDGKKSGDVRLGAPKTLNDYFPFVVPKTKELWEARRKVVREQLLVANGLWPLPGKTPLNAVVHGKTEHDGYTIEKVYFASTPGHYVCGNLYRPLVDNAKPQKFPGVLFAHGHWANGRFHDAGEQAAKASVAAKGEPDVDRGRFFMQALPATLAKLGFVVFQYDMVGYADSTAIAHREGFKDTEAELRLQSQMGLQTWNSMRSLDFLSSLPDVDAKRIGMTGASGGGTQTFILAAIDDRISAAFPAVMVSTGMQGGCVCENCSLLRVNTGNVEIAALFGPKPQAMSAANDWTKEMMTKGYPELQALYDLYGAKDKVAVRAWLEYGHQYNVHAREMMYAWFLKHLQNRDEKFTEPAFKPVPPKELSVFNDKHPRPKDELTAPKLREAMTKASDDQLAKLTPKDAASLKEYKRVVGSALRAMVVSDLPKEIAVRMGPLESKPDGLTMHRAAFGRKDEKDAVPGCGVFSATYNGDKAVIWLHPKGKASLFENGKAVPAVKSLTDAGFAIVAPDLLGTGENSFEKPIAVDKTFAGYTFGYNRTLLANRVHDALTFLAFGTTMLKAKQLAIVGWDAFGPIAVLARAIAGDVVTKTAADLNQFTFESVKEPTDAMLLPGALKYGGLGAFLALCAPGEVLVHNHKGTETGRISRAAYDAAGAAKSFTRNAEKLEVAKVIEWLTKN